MSLCHRRGWCGGMGAGLTEVSPGWDGSVNVPGGMGEGVVVMDGGGTEAGCHKSVTKWSEYGRLSAGQSVAQFSYKRDFLCAPLSRNIQQVFVCFLVNASLSRNIHHVFVCLLVSVLFDYA